MQSTDTRRKLLKSIGVVSLGTGLAGCTGGGTGNDIPDERTTATTNGPLFDLDALEPDKLMGKGPFGGEPHPPQAVALNDQQVKRVRNKDFNIAVVFHYQTDTGVQLQEKAMRRRCAELGISISSIQYAGFDAQQQVNILETIAQQKNIDGIISIPVDTAATKSGYRAVADAGKEIVFMDNVPMGFSHPEDYAGVVTIDNRGMGIIGGRMMKQLVDSGKILIFEFDTPFYVVEEREIGVKNTLREGDYQLKTFGFSDSGDVLQLAQDAITANPDTKGVWAPWVDPPGAQAIQAITGHGKDIPVTSCDLGTRGAVLMAEQSPLQGIGAQRPYDQGTAEVNMLAQKLLGNETPSYVAFPAPAVARQNLLKMYKQIIHSEPPKSVTKYYK